MNNTLVEAVLKPCPFCGAKPLKGPTKVQHCQLHGEPFQRFAVHCPHRCARIERVNEAEAITAWNTRALRPATVQGDVVEVAVYSPTLATDLRSEARDCDIGAMASKDEIARLLRLAADALDELTAMQPATQAAVDALPPAISSLTHTDKASWIETIWRALDALEDVTDAEWDDICTAMAWISEALSLDTGSIAEEPTPG